MAPSRGLDDRGFLRAKHALKGPLIRARQRAGEIGMAIAIERCPVGDRPINRPHLWETIRVQTNQYVTELVAGDKQKGVIHAGYVEFGTSQHAPNPYMSPAVTAMKRIFVDEVKRGVRGALR